MFHGLWYLKLFYLGCDIVDGLEQLWCGDTHRTKPTSPKDPRLPTLLNMPANLHVIPTSDPL